MSLDQHSLFGPLTRFLKSLPVLTVTLILIPFVAPSVTRWLVEPLLPSKTYHISDNQVNERSWELKHAQVLQENQELKDLIKKMNTMKFTKFSVSPKLLARNLGHSPQLFRRGMVLSFDQHEKNILNGPVVYKNNLIGLVDGVHKNWCHVQLVSDPEFNIAVDIISERESESWPNGICGGQTHISGGSEVLVKFIDNSRFKDIKKGDSVITNGLDFKVQKGLLIGRVKDIVKKDLFLYITVSLEVNPRKIPLYAILPSVPNPFKTNKDEEGSKK